MGFRSYIEIIESGEKLYLGNIYKNLKIEGEIPYTTTTVISPPRTIILFQEQPPAEIGFETLFSAENKNSLSYELLEKTLERFKSSSYDVTTIKFPLKLVLAADIKYECSLVEYELILKKIKGKPDQYGFRALFQGVLITAELNKQESTVVSADKYRIKIKLVDQDKNPIANENCTVTFPCGTKKLSRTNNDGIAEVLGPSEGDCTIEFTGLDNEHFGMKSKSSDEGENYTVQKGDSLSLIAKRYQTTWKKIWDDPKNRGIKEKRKNPNILYAGDVFFVPSSSAPKLKAKTGATVEYKVNREKEYVYIRFAFGSKARANEQFTLVVGNNPEIKGTTDDQGRVKIEVMAGAQFAKIIFRSNKWNEEIYNLKIGDLDPLNEDSGVKQRLQNLGMSVPNNTEIPVSDYLAIFNTNLSEENIESLDRLKDLHGV